MAAPVLFDLGNTLAAYYHRGEFRPVLARAVAGTAARLRAAGIPTAAADTLLARALRENREAPDHRFAPLRDRLARIFDLQPDAVAGFGEELCREFLGPIFAMGRVYGDVPSLLTTLRARGHRTAIVSNTPWGSPPDLWRTELERLGLSRLVDAVVLCGDVGWRKPAPPIFERAAAAVGARCDECVFVGDDPEWDVAGSTGVGMRAVLIDRDDRFPVHTGARIRSLAELPPLLT